MNFSEALHDIKNGFRGFRGGWNGPNQYVVLQNGYPDGIPINANTAQATGLPEGAVCIFRPYLMLCTADGSFVPWAPSVSDVLADDWHIDPRTIPASPAAAADKVTRKAMVAARVAEGDAWSESDDQLIEAAFGIIATAWDGAVQWWGGQLDWEVAATLWTDRYHKRLKRTSTTVEEIGSNDREATHLPG